jgi:hypothetical protein
MFAISRIQWSLGPLIERPLISFESFANLVGDAASESVYPTTLYAHLLILLPGVPQIARAQTLAQQINRRGRSILAAGGL